MRWSIPLCVALLFGSGVAAAFPLDHLRTTDDIGLNKVPHLGTSHVLVIPVRVGVRNISLGELSELQRLFNPDGGPGTFRKYWQDVSGGRYDPVPVLADPVLYPDSCPVPGKSVNDCTVSISDIGLLFSRGLRDGLANIITRVRDEQGMDLSQFDVNTANGPGADGYFDGVIMDTDIYQGIAPPLAALDNAVSIESMPGGGGPVLEMGIVAMIPPAFHEYGHVLGFIDLYGGPTVNGLMEDIDATLSPFSRQQVEWGTVVDIAGPMSMDLPPVLDSQVILRIGQAPRYLLLENRGGPKHAEYEEGHPGVYVYSIDESTLPTTQLGFLARGNSGLYLPNAEAPYLQVTLPVACTIGTAAARGTCALAPGEERRLVHASGADTNLAIRASTPAADGTVRVDFYRPGAPLDAGVADLGVASAIDAGTPSAGSGAGGKKATSEGCNSTGAAAWWLAIPFVWFTRRRRALRPEGAAQPTGCATTAPASSAVVGRAKLALLVGLIAALGCAEPTVSAPLSVADAPPVVTPVRVEPLPGVRVALEPTATPVPAPRLVVRHAGAAITAGATIVAPETRRYAPASALTLDIANEGGLALSITSVTIGSDFSLQFSLRSIGPGATGQITVALADTTSAGDSQSELTLTTNDPAQPEFSVAIEATVAPYIGRALVPMPSVDVALRTKMSQDNLVGVAVGIARGQDIVYLGGQGLADVANGVPVDATATMFRWASLSKTVTGAAAVIAASDGDLDLDLNISTYVADYSVPRFYLPGDCRSTSCQEELTGDERFISTRMLLHHIAGVMHYSNGLGSPNPNPIATNTPVSNTGIAWALSTWIDKPLVAKPSTAYSYSTFGFNLAGVVVERAVERPFWSFVRDRIAEPLEMTTFQPDYEWVDIPNRAVGYRPSGTGWANVGSSDVSWKLPGGGFISTAEDLTKWCAGLLGDRVLSDEMKTQAWTPRSPANAYGLGFGVGSSNGRRLISHTGSQQKAKTAVRIYPDDDVCFVVMSNSDNASPSSVSRAVEAAYDWN